MRSMLVRTLLLLVCINISLLNFTIGRPLRKRPLSAEDQAKIEELTRNHRECEEKFKKLFAAKKEDFVSKKVVEELKAQVKDFMCCLIAQIIYVSENEFMELWEDPEFKKVLSKYVESQRSIAAYINNSRSIGQQDVDELSELISGCEEFSELNFGFGPVGWDSFMLELKEDPELKKLMEEKDELGKRRKKALDDTVDTLIGLYESANKDA